MGTCAYEYDIDMYLGRRQPARIVHITSDTDHIYNPPLVKCEPLSHSPAGDFIRMWSISPTPPTAMVVRDNVTGKVEEVLIFDDSPVPP
jgi:hypothetical protein